MWYRPRLSFPVHVHAALQTLIPVTDTDITQNYTAQSGDRVVLPCPIQPGALLQSYSVIWMEDSVEIANSQTGRITNSRYGINGTTFALIIDPVNVNDTSSSYQCQVFVTNPITNTKQRLQYYPSGVQISLAVNQTSGNNLSIYTQCQLSCPISYV